MLARVLYLAVCLVCTVLPLTSMAQGMWSLTNISNETLQFETFDQARGSWKNQSIFPNEAKAFTMSAGTQVGKIRIRTAGRGYVEYDVRLGWKYNLVWDNNKGVWDLRTRQRG